MFGVYVLTVSDSSYKDGVEKSSGPALEDYLTKNNFKVVNRGIVSDDRSVIEDKLLELDRDENISLVVTTGGTGCSKRDNTPEATINVCERIVPGIAEEMRRKASQSTREALLSRAVCGIRQGTLIINLPGGQEAAIAYLSYIIDVIPEALKILAGIRKDCLKIHKNDWGVIDEKHDRLWTLSKVRWKLQC